MWKKINNTAKIIATVLHFPVPQFPVLHFPAPTFGPTNTGPAFFSSPDICPTFSGPANSDSVLSASPLPLLYIRKRNCSEMLCSFYNIRYQTFHCHRQCHLGYCFSADMGFSVRSFGNANIVLPKEACINYCCEHPSAKYNLRVNRRFQISRMHRPNTQPANRMSLTCYISVCLSIISRYVR